MTTAAPSAKAVKQAIQWMLRLRESGNSPVLLQQCEQWRSARHEHELAWQRVVHLHQDLDLRAIPGAGVALQTLETSQRRLHRRQALKLLGCAAMAARRHGWPKTSIPSAAGLRITRLPRASGVASSCPMAR